MDEIIKECLQVGDICRANRLRIMAQTEFNLICETNGQYLSPYPDINNIFNGSVFADNFTVTRPPLVLNETSFPNIEQWKQTKTQHLKKLQLKLAG